MEHLPLGTVKYLRILVSDVERSKEFYSEVLGFEIEHDSIPPRERRAGRRSWAG